MKSNHRALILAVALAVHGLALAAFDASIVQMKIREVLAQHEPARIVVTEPGAPMRTLATQSCPAPRG